MAYTVFIKFHTLWMCLTHPFYTQPTLYMAEFFFAFFNVNFHKSDMLIEIFLINHE
jgi:hypothetical protein